MKRISLCLFALLAGILLTACGSAGNDQWHSHNIDGVTADLAFHLVDENGNQVTAKDYAGKVRLVYFGYTHCPDVCPMEMAHMAAVINKLPKAKRDAVRVLFISVDPKRDPPARLKAWTAHFGPRFIGLTGTQDELRDLAKRFRITYSYNEPNKYGFYVVNHSDAVFVFDGKGEARLLLKQDESIADIAEDLQRLIRQSS